MALNETLYRQLRNVLGEVIIDKEGEAFSGKLGRRATTGKLYVHQTNPGEAYRVNCPFCGDTRHRLYINHMWRAGFCGQSTDNLLTCFNEDCLCDRVQRSEFIKMVDKGDRLACAVINQGVSVPEVTLHPMPGEVIPIDHVPAMAPIRAYLEGRGYDMAELAREWGVLWIVNHTDKDLMAKRIKDSYRLLFPVYGYHGKELGMLGWQIRYFDSFEGSGTPPNKHIPKYYTRGKVGNVLYNGYRCKGGPAICVGEGVLDAIKFGWDIGTCTFGKSISRNQQKLLWAGWGARKAWMVSAYDADLTSKDQAKRDDFMRYWVNKLVIPFEDGYDPGDYTREQLRQYLIDHGVGITLNIGG